MTQDWKPGFRRAVSDMLQNEGRFVARGYAYYGDGWSNRHTTPAPYGDGCTVKAVDASTARDESFASFAGTFSSDHETTVLVAKATCSCGQYTDADFGWEGSLTEALHTLLRDG